jgi:hypothetical protein
MQIFQFCALPVIAPLVLSYLRLYTYDNCFGTHPIMYTKDVRLTAQGPHVVCGKY